MPGFTPDTDQEPVKPLDNPDWPETRAKILDAVEEWYWKHGLLLWNTDESRPALRELRRILFPNGGGDVS